MILVDYQNKAIEERPDFYILTSDDWKNWVSIDGWVAEDSRFTLKKGNIPVGHNNEGKESWEGVNVEANDIGQYKEKWEKVEALLKRVKTMT